jgi:DNA-binding response OmpR family regulator
MEMLVDWRSDDYPRAQKIMSTRILMVEDDGLLRQSLKYCLESEGYACVPAGTGEQALSFARCDRPDLILLDIGLPDCDGLDLARILYREMDIPIIFLTGRREQNDIVAGLELGAEDYVVKPFEMRELLARIRVVLRRATRAPLPGRDDPLVAGAVTLDPKKHEVRVRGMLVELPPKEFELLRLLMANAGTVLTTDHLLNAVWGQEFVGAPEVLYVHIGWLRERIEADPRRPCYIQTVRGIGYKFIVGESEP